MTVERERRIEVIDVLLVKKDDRMEKLGTEGELSN